MSSGIALLILSLLAGPPVASDCLEGFMAVHVANGMIVGAAADVTRLTARERTWLTHRLASVGAAAVGTLILLQTD